MSEAISVKEFSNLTDVLYEGIQEDVPWKSFLHSLQDQMHANSATFILRPPSSDADGIIVSTGENTDDEVVAYNKQFFALDPFVDLPHGKVVTLDEFIPEREQGRSDYFSQYLAPMNVYHIVGTDIHTKDGAHCSLRISRGKQAESFSLDDKEVVELLVPHLESAVKIHMRLNRVKSERNLYAGAVNQLAVGAIILDEDGKIMKVNQVAEELINDNDGLKITGKTLQVGTSSDTRKLREMIRNALNSHNKDHTPSLVEALRIQRLSGASDLGIVVRPIPMEKWSEGIQCPSVAIFISDPERKSKAPQEIVKALFDLTPAESQLAMLLANGLTLDETAETLCVSRNTARAHLRSIFSKTGVTRQTMLVRLILKSVASLG
ncbi:LuxR family transcriptional regulator [Endozoicomonas montiporae]|uniref:LuxR family transcriptional regulator n=2 Tax=Endozoicomonas montiporae TaxID=1027273 RepID=A0A081N824_9GAMM|nr:LuxR C-terminal-related transcriptional regulator [Endozoicomonas montiporae]AMO55519.1 putative transcriptional regulatory protein [Endozoicomonas montiporae CL-33]KEQ14597.1 LuxR family transcriptional regulator [Endozoicomonas montiporae]